jgi:hypothetical protein
MRATIFSKLWMLTLLVIVATSIRPPAARAQIWGQVANPGFDGQRIKTTLFFAGQARGGTIRYNNNGTICNPGNDAYEYVRENERVKYGACIVDADHKDLRVVDPLAPAHLKWSENSANRDLALNLMVEAGLNVISMSCWGEDFLPCAWTTAAAPMQTDPEALSQLFDAAMNKPVLIIPFLGTHFGTNTVQPSLPWQFYNEFPMGLDSAVAPGTISQITNLIYRYLRNNDHPEWAGKWARVYDQDGQARYAVAIIRAASNQQKACTMISIARSARIDQ